MGESETHQRAATTTSSRLGIRGGIGEIVEVQGGHIVRSTGRKDRHSKVCTAKGPRDRRVRLSAHTAIQFYDVQDRLGYDRPSKAVDWLIKKAKTAIDELAELPAWNPNTSAIYTNSQQRNQQINEENEAENAIGVHRPPVDAIGSGISAGGGARVSETSARNLHQQQQQQQQQQFEENPNGSSSFLPPSLDHDIADTIKTFFPIGASAAAAAESPSIQFQNYPPDLLSRTSSSSQNQDLRLSLQSLQDPILLHQAQQHHQAQAQAQAHHHHNEQVLFSGTSHLGFDGTSTGWSEHHPEEHGRLLRMVAWNAAAGADTGNNSAHGGGGFIFNSPSPASSQFPPTPLFGQNQYLSQRGPLQSSNNSSIRAWIDPSSSIVTTTATSIADHHYHHYLPATLHHQSSSLPLSGIGFASGGFSGFRIPARIQGEEEHDGVSDKPSSASSDSRH